MERLSVRDGAASFHATVVEAETPSRVVVFAVGGGGNPERHGPLLTALAEAGCSVVAPHFERMVSPIPTDDDLLLRARRLRLAIDAVATAGLPAVGVGHSIGATMLLALAGGQVWMGPGRRLPIVTDDRVERLALMAPATGYFQAPGALDAIRAPILAWVGTEDAITPPAHIGLLVEVLGKRLPVEVRVVQGAGHFSFMNVPPPQLDEPLPDRDAFLASLTGELCDFVVH